MEVSNSNVIIIIIIMQADLDLRKTLYGNIVLSGGSTLFPGFGDRLLHEVKRLAPKEVKIKLSFLSLFIFYNYFVIIFIIVCCMIIFVFILIGTFRSSFSSIYFRFITRRRVDY